MEYKNYNNKKNSDLVDGKGSGPAKFCPRF